MRAAVPVLAALLAAGPAAAQVLDVEIGRVGVVEPTETDVPETPPADGNLVGSSPQRPARFTKLGSAIDARFCMLFGFEFRAPNMPAPLEFPVVVQLDHPLWTRPDGRSGTQERFHNLLTSEWSYTGYHLEESWTLVPGTWRFTVLTGDKVLATQSFELSVAPGQSLPTNCGAPVS